MPAQKELRILLWGFSGAGKSQFIDSVNATVTIKDATGKEFKKGPVIGRTPDACTMIVAPYSFYYKDTLVTLVDIPGLDGNLTMKDELEESNNDDKDPDAVEQAKRISDEGKIFESIAAWLHKAHAMFDNEPYFHGVVYLYDITAPRFTPAERECFTMLEKMLGPAMKDNTWIVMNKADKLSPLINSKDRDWKKTVRKDLAEKKLPTYKDRIIEKDGTKQRHVERVLEKLLGPHPVELQVVKELEDGASLAETTAGKYLQKKYNATIEQLQRGIEIMDDIEKEKELQNWLEALKKEKDDLFSIDKNKLHGVADAVTTAGVSAIGMGALLFIVPGAQAFGVPIAIVGTVVAAGGAGMKLLATFMKDKKA